MKSLISIEKISVKEVAQLREIGRQTFYETFVFSNTKEDMKSYLDANFSIEKLASELSNLDSQFYFAKEGHQILGYLKINSGKSQTESFQEESLEIERIYVYKAFMRRKIGQLLCDKALQVAKIKKVKFVWLGVWEHNKKAIAFYEKNGFIAFDEHIFMMGVDKQTDRLMKLEL